MRILITFILALAFSLITFAQTTKKDTLTFGSDKYFPPYEYLNKNGVAKGFNIDIIKALAREMNVEIIIKLDDWIKIRHELEVDETVDFSDMFYSEKRDSIVDYAFPHDIVFDKVYVHKSSQPVVKIEDLSGKNVSVLKGSVHEEYLQSKYPEIRLLPQNTELEALQMVAEKRCHAAIVTSISGKQLLKNSLIRNVVGYGNMILPSEYCFVVKEGNAELLEKINLALANLMADGTIEKLRNKWFEEKIFGVRLNLIRFGIIIMFLSLLLSYLLNYILNLKVRKRRKQLILSEERWQFATEGAGDGVWDWNAQTNKVFFSPHWKKMLGHEENEIGNSIDEWDKRIHPDDKEQVYIDLNKHLNGETHEYVNEHRVLCKNGTYKWILDRGKVFERTKDGKPLRVVGTHTDISERKKVEEKIQLSEKRFRLISNVASNYVFESEIDDTGKLELKWVFGAFENLTGYTFEEFKAQGGWRTTVHPDDLKIDDNDLKNLSVNKKIETEIRTFTKKGNIVWNRIYANPIWDEKQQKLVGIYGAVQDITERKKAQEETNWYAAIVSSSPNMMAILDKDFRYLAANTAYFEVFKLTRNEIIGHTMADNFGDKFFEETIKPYAEKCLAGQNVNYREWFNFPAFPPMYMDISYFPFYDSNKQIIGFIVNGRDFTERKKAKEEIRKIDKQLISTMESMTDAFIALDNDWHYTYMNKNAGNIINRNPKSMIGKHIWTEFPNDVGKPFYKACYKAIKTQTPQFLTLFYAPFNKWFENRIFPSQNGLSIFFSDITENVKAEKEIRESEERFRTVFEQSASGMCLVDVDGKLITVNTPLCEMLAYSQNELEGIHFSTITHPDDMKIGVNAINKMVAGKLKKVVFEKRYLKKSGEIIWAHINSTLLRDDNNNPKYFVTQIEDITEHIKTNMALKSSENKYKALVEQSLTGIYILSENSFIYANKRLCEIFGYSQKEILTDLEPADTISVEYRDSSTQYIKQRLSGELQSVRYVAKGNHKTGKLLWVEIHGTHIKLEGIDVIAGTVLDITERKVAEESIKKLNEELEQKVEERTKDLEVKISEIQRMNKLFVGRELRMKELKEKLKELENKQTDKK